ncbi:alpha/beta fold hydrolase [Aneurinibacillus terranovensis]|uniref:alpha/beta fold hydrolase n=1 Tax=Aneurinibacillus terranovensis TaxID=278991 RepID=UPI0004226B46|nr:alpha/beta hydrolase [Aneurinibacillus terranovensis]
MSLNHFMDVSPADERWGHGMAPGVEGVQLHYVRQGMGPSVILLHGWPGFWYDWRHVIPKLALQADVIAPDFRGYGDSEKPDLPPAQGYTPQVFAKDIIALLEHLNLDKVIVAAHDIGATVAQALVRIVPERIHSLILLNPPYPGIGTRRFDPSVQGQFWYQHLHNQPWAEQLIGYDRNTVKLYISHFYQHWAGRKESVRPKELEAIIDVYSRPGAVKSSIAYYRARAGARAQEAAADPTSIQVHHPTTVLWGEDDPVMLAAWSDKLGEYFSRLSFRMLPGIGHFVPWEAPNAVIEAIQAHLE